MDTHYSTGLVTTFKCAAWWQAVYGASAIERPLETIRKEKGISLYKVAEFLPDSGCLRRLNMTKGVEKT